MSRRRSTELDSSLDLLLDTITNTFGGVLFMAILITVLLRVSQSAESANEPTADDPLEMTSLRSEIESAELVLQNLRIANDNQDEFRSQLRDALTDDAVAEWKALRTKNNQLAADVHASENEVQQIEEDTTVIQQASDRVEQELKTTEDELKSKQVTLRQELNRRQVKANLPLARRTQKSESAIVLRYDRVYQPIRRVGASLASRFNTDDFVIVNDDSASVTLTPKPYRGIAASSGKALMDGLRQYLAGRPPSEYYVAVAVWEDSFDTFQDLKGALIELGYQYRLIFIPNGAQLSTGFVGDTRVQ